MSQMNPILLPLDTRFADITVDLATRFKVIRRYEDKAKNQGKPELSAWLKTTRLL